MLRADADGRTPRDSRGQVHARLARVRSSPRSDFEVQRSACMTVPGPNARSPCAYSPPSSKSTE